MAKKTDRSSILQDIKNLSKLLDKYKFKDHRRIELDKLEKLIDTLEKNLKSKNKKKVVISTTEDGIGFHTLTNGLAPNPATVKSKLDIFLNMEYELLVDGANIDELVTKYKLNLNIKGVQKNTRNLHFFGWHLDLQPIKNEKNKKETRYHFIHPYFHFHAGGRSIADKGPGSLMMLNSPRLPHPPLDIVLAINFVLCNFFNVDESAFSEEMKILDDQDYRNLVESAAERLFEPYFKEISGNIKNNKLIPLFT